MQLPDFKKINIIVLGDIMLDHYSIGETNRISPEAPVPTVLIKTTEYRPGGAANVAHNLATLGCNASIMGHIGMDHAGDTINQLLANTAVNNQLLQHGSTKTTNKHRIISQGQQLLRIDTEEHHQADLFPLLTSNLLKNISNADAIILSDYNKGTLHDPQTIIKHAISHNLPIIIDPKGDNFNKYRNATMLTPNNGEFNNIVGHCHTMESRIERGTKLLKELQLTALLITLGKEGMLLLTKNEEPLHITTKQQEVFDVTGAGDTVIAVATAMIAAKQPISNAIKAANTAASIVIRKSGTSTITAETLQHKLNSTVPSAQKLIYGQKIKNIRSELCPPHGKLVMTNGCFDILHAGHIDYLEQAKALGDRLLIAVNSDESVKRLKGDSRPINSLQDRMAVLAGLECVDLVIPFNEDTPKRLIAEVMPDILVKGGDYEICDIAGGESVLANGGQVLTIPCKPNCSTTNVINKILNHSPLKQTEKI